MPTFMDTNASSLNFLNSHLSVLFLGPLATTPLPALVPGCRLGGGRMPPSGPDLATHEASVALSCHLPGIGLLFRHWETCQEDTETSL